MRRENQTLMDDELSTLICKTDQVTPCFNALLHLILSRKLDLVLLTDCSHDRWQKTEATQNSCSSWVAPNLWMQMTCTGMFLRDYWAIRKEFLLRRIMRLGGQQAQLLSYAFQKVRSSPQQASFLLIFWFSNLHHNYGSMHRKIGLSTKLHPL